MGRLVYDKFVPKWCQKTLQLTTVNVQLSKIVNFVFTPGVASRGGEEARAPSSPPN